jgi:serine/threonine protein phosphatase PrpC
MGNGIGKAYHCFAGDGEISKRHRDVGVVLSDPLDEGLGHSFCYVRPEPPRLSYSSQNSEEDTQDRDSVAMTAFRSISGASVSANTSTPPSTCLADLIGPSGIDRAASFASSTSFASTPLQPVRRCSTCELVPGSGPIERGFMSGPMERGFLSGPIDSGPIEKAAREQLPIENIVKSKKRRHWFNNFKKLISSTIACGLKPVVAPVKGGVNASDSGGCIHLKDGEYFKERESLQWAQGKAGEDRVQVVISEEHGWVFVGIYDGFNGPDATEYLISKLYSAVHRELKGNESQSRNFDEENEISGHEETMDLDSNSKRKQSNSSKNKRNVESDGERSDHSEVLKALSEALRKTEDEYLDIADKMVRNYPELALIGSCVLVMLMKGEDVYLMNVGDSRAVLAQEAEVDDLRPREVHQDLKRTNEEILSDQNFYFGVACGALPNLVPLQLTTDHSAYVEEVIYI